MFRPRLAGTPVTLWLVVMLLLLAAAQAARAADPGPVGQPFGQWREQLHWVPEQDESGSTRLLYTRICRPLTDAPARVVVINHGTPADATMRPTMKPTSCTSEAAQWFLGHGYVVVAGMRRGYGETGGGYAEESGSCSRTDFVKSAVAGARDIDAILRYAVALPFARPNGAVIVGQSAGGWATDGYNSVPHPLVAAMVSMAGGRGGHIHDIPNNNCRPDELVAAAGILGKTATTPMLWVYTANDSFFAPSLSKAMFDAFSASGGKVDFHALPAFAADGHSLFFGKGGSAIWAPIMQAYLETMVRK